jgi:hypothetical protein
MDRLGPPIYSTHSDSSLLSQKDLTKVDGDVERWRTTFQNESLSPLISDAGKILPDSVTYWPMPAFVNSDLFPIYLASVRSGLWHLEKIRACCFNESDLQADA